jgi:hypothetical protein
VTSDNERAFATRLRQLYPDAPPYQTEYVFAPPRHGADVEAIQRDAAYQALKQAVDLRKAKQQGASEQ